MNAIYLDNNATTPMLPAVWEAMQPYLFDKPGNPASSHSFGRQARQALEDARERMAVLLDAPSRRSPFHQRRHRGKQPRHFRLLRDVSPGTSWPATSSIPAFWSQFAGSRNEVSLIRDFP